MPQVRTFAVAALLAGALAYSGPALSHAKRTDTVPADGSSVKFVEKISIGFTMPMRVTSVKLLAGDAEVPIIRDTGMKAVKVFTGAPAKPLPAGPYTIEWRGMSPDGHVMRGDIDFTVVE